MAYACVLPILLALVACGARILDPETTDGAAPGAPDGAAKLACEPRAGCASTTWCAEACNECSCDPSTGTWACTKRVCPDAQPSECPQEPPQSGSLCGVEGQSCVFADKCSPQCVCTGAHWSCNENPCGLPCPAQAPVNREACEGRGRVCHYSGFCAPTCVCEAFTPERDAWKCSTRPC